MHLLFYSYQCANLSQAKDFVSSLIFSGDNSWLVSISNSKQAKTVKKPLPKTSKTRKPWRGAGQSMELSFGLLAFTRAFSQPPIIIIKSVSHSGSCISWSGVLRKRFSFSKKAGWLGKPWPGANQPMQLSVGLLIFTRVSVRLPSIIIKSVFHDPGNRRAVFSCF